MVWPNPIGASNGKHCMAALVDPRKAGPSLYPPASCLSITIVPASPISLSVVVQLALYGAPPFKADQSHELLRVNGLVVLLKR